MSRYFDTRRPPRPSICSRPRKRAKMRAFRAGVDDAHQTPRAWRTGSRAQELADRLGRRRGDRDVARVAAERARLLLQRPRVRARHDRDERLRALAVREWTLGSGRAVRYAESMKT